MINASHYFQHLIIKTLQIFYALQKDIKMQQFFSSAYFMSKFEMAMNELNYAEL